MRDKREKPLIAVDISTTGKGGGPYTSTMNLINSSLKYKYDYHIFNYDTSIGRYVSLKRILKIARELRKIKPDIVHFTGLQFSGFHIAVACLLAGVKRSVVVIHGSSTEALDISNNKKRILVFLEKITLRIATTFYGVSKYSSMIDVTKPYRHKSSGYVYNLPTFVLYKESSPYQRNEFDISENDVVVATVGRITKDKGYHILKDTIQQICSGSNVKFLIIGKGSYLEEMKKCLEKNISNGTVKFLGYRDDVSRILPICDIFVLPTLHETLSIALLEASYFGLPLIASNVGGVPEIINNGDNGYLVPPSDANALAEKITMLVEDKYLRTKMGQRAKDKLKDKFSEDSIVLQIDAIYCNLLNDKA